VAPQRVRTVGYCEMLAGGVSDSRSGQAVRLPERPSRRSRN